SNIMAIISRLRKKIELDPSSPIYLQTIKGIGYQFNTEV
ncbi:TPA: helix-turn-helix domain-containing protein, partial [Clostridioides difficile]